MYKRKQIFCYSQKSLNLCESDGAILSIMLKIGCLVLCIKRIKLYNFNFSDFYDEIVVYLD